MIGQSPDPYTLRELVWAAEGARDFHWDQTAEILALIYNANRGKNQRAKRPADWKPWQQAQRHNSVPLGTMRANFATRRKIKPWRQPQALSGPAGPSSSSSRTNRS